MEKEVEYMHRALHLAELGAGATSPNPLVGAVLVKHGNIIGQGFHQHYGGPHAEIEALNQAGEEARGSTLYVTLEPCSHHGKTPPCCEAIVRSGVSRVLCPVEDPNPLVSGNGFSYLRENGVEVSVGLLRKEAEKLNEIFFHFIKQKKPFVILKNAMSLDGKIATRTGKSKWISSQESREFVHRLRHRVSAIVVGVNTVIQDDPMLTPRIEGLRGSKLLRIVLDSSGRTPPDAKLLKTANDSPVLIVSSPKILEERKRLYEQQGAEVAVLDSEDYGETASLLLNVLQSKNIDSLLVEGGGIVAETFIRAGLVNKYVTCIAPIIIGGVLAPTPVGGQGIDELTEALTFKDISISRLGGDIVVEAYPK